MYQIDIIVHATFVVASPEEDGISALFGDNPHMAYEVYKYIVLWLNWKVEDPRHNDERYFAEYFSDYSKDERKRVLRSFAPDLLDFVATPSPTTTTTPLSDALQYLIYTTIPEIAPLLDDLQLSSYWTFLEKLSKCTPGDPLTPTSTTTPTTTHFLTHLTDTQLSRIILSVLASPQASTYKSSLLTATYKFVARKIVKTVDEEALASLVATLDKDGGLFNDLPEGDVEAWSGGNLKGR
ncbi:hypothetical protein HK097_004975, partial [Rhizophlyctis rosea]